MFDFLQAKKEERNQVIRQGIEQRPFNFQRVKIYLDVDFPGGVPTPSGVKQKFSFPFASVHVVDASSNTAYVNLIPTDDTLQNISSVLPLKKAGSYKTGSLISGCYLGWNMQPGEWVDLLFILEGEFDSGQVVSIAGGGSATTEGTAVVSSRISQVGAGSGVLLAADGNRNTVHAYVVSGSLYYGDAGVAAGAPQTGTFASAGQSFVIKNQGAWTYYSPAGCEVNLNVQS